MTELKQTPLFDMYKAYGGKIIDFGGWALPVQFSSIKEEHIAVRSKAGLFDVSHMGEIIVRGEKSFEFLQRVMTNDLTNANEQKAIYSMMCYENGTVVDDLIIYPFGEDEYLLVVNASNIEKDYKWLCEQNHEGVEIVNVSNEYAQLAIQGPSANEILQKLTDYPLNKLKFFEFKREVEVAGISCLVSRTGYTGEDGFELYVTGADPSVLWVKLLEVGQDRGLVPCGLGARDTLRLESKLPLYGQEISNQITPLEAGMGFAVKFTKDFVGSIPLKQMKESGPPRKLVGIEMLDPGIPRHSYPLFVDGEEIGVVTSGTQIPSTKRNVGLALIQKEHSDLGTIVEVEIRGKRVRASIVPSPFYKRGK